MSRLSYYSELSGESYSSIKRKWKDALLDGIKEKRRNPKSWEKFCNRLAENSEEWFFEAKWPSDAVALMVEAVLNGNKSI